jgi:hypothetical protein
MTRKRGIGKQTRPGIVRKIEGLDVNAPVAPVVCIRQTSTIRESLRVRSAEASTFEMMIPVAARNNL